MRCPVVDTAAVACGFAYEVAGFGLNVDGLVVGDGRWGIGAYPIIETLAVNVGELWIY